MPLPFRHIHPCRFYFLDSRYCSRTWDNRSHIALHPKTNHSKWSLPRTIHLPTTTTTRVARTILYMPGTKTLNTYHQTRKATLRSASSHSTESMIPTTTLSAWSTTTRSTGGSGRCWSCASLAILASRRAGVGIATAVLCLCAIVAGVLATARAEGKYLEASRCQATFWDASIAPMCSGSGRRLSMPCIGRRCIRHWMRVRVSCVMAVVQIH